MPILTLESMKNGELGDIDPLNRNFETIRQSINAIESAMYDVTSVGERVGNLFELNTKVKTSIVGAINALIVPTGSLLIFPMEITPDGYLPARGGNYSRTVYANLFNVYGTIFGVGDGSTTFGMPNFSGNGLIGYLEGVTEKFGVKQKSGIPNITGTFGFGGTEYFLGIGGAFYEAYWGGSRGTNHKAGSNPVVGMNAARCSSVYKNVDRVIIDNLAVHVCIKY